MNTIIKSFLTYLLAWSFLLCSRYSKGQVLPDTLTLDGLITIAQEQSLGKDSAQMALQRAQLNFQIFKAQLKPRLELGARLPNFIKTSSAITQPNGTVFFQSISNNNASLDLSLDQAIPATGGIVFFQTNLQRFDDFANDDQSYNGVPFRFGIQQPIWGFNALKWNKKLAPIRWQVAQKSFHQNRENINQELVRLFFQLQFAHLDRQIAMNNAASNQDLYNIAEERFELGKISRGDLLQLEGALIRSLMDQDLADQAARNATAQIYAYLGSNYKDQQHIPALQKVNQSITISVDQAIEQARLNRPEITDLWRARQEAARAVASAKGNGGVQANLVASFGVTRSADDLPTIYNNPQQEQFVQLQLNVPILDWGAQKNTVQLAKAQQIFNEKRLNQFEIDFKNEILQAVENFQTIQNQLKLMQQLREIALQRFEITKESYVLGAINLRELTLSQAEKDQAIREYGITLQNYWVQYYQLRALTLYDFKDQQSIIYSFEK